MQKVVLQKKGKVQKAAFKNTDKGGYTSVDLVAVDDNGNVEILDDLYIKGNQSGLQGMTVTAIVEITARVRNGVAELRGMLSEPPQVLQPAK